MYVNTHSMLMLVQHENTQTYTRKFITTHRDLTAGVFGIEKYIVHSQPHFRTFQFLLSCHIIVEELTAYIQQPNFNVNCWLAGACVEELCEFFFKYNIIWNFIVFMYLYFGRL